MLAVEGRLRVTVSLCSYHCVFDTLDTVLCAHLVCWEFRWSCQQLLQHPWLSSLAIGEGDVSSPTMEQFFSEHDPDMQLDMQLEYRTLEFEDTAPTEQLEYLSAETVDESPRCKRRRHNRSGERIVVLEHAGRSTQQLAQDIVQAVETEFDGVQAEVNMTQYHCSSNTLTIVLFCCRLNSKL